MKANRKYLVDMGDRCHVWNEGKVQRYYAREIDHTEYPSFDDWMWDMMRCGLVTEVLR